MALCDGWKLFLLLLLWGRCLLLRLPGHHLQALMCFSISGAVVGSMPACMHAKGANCYSRQGRQSAPAFCTAASKPGSMGWPGELHCAAAVHDEGVRNARDLCGRHQLLPRMAHCHLRCMHAI